MKARTLALLAIPVLLCVLVVAILLANSWLRSFLRGPDFLELVSKKTSSALQVSGTYQPLSWTGFSVHSAQFRAYGEPGSRVAFLQADQIRTSLLWRDAFRGVWKLDGISIGQARVLLGAEAGAHMPPRPVANADSTPPISLPSWLPKSVDPGEVHIDSATVEFGKGGLRGTSATLRQQGSGWDIQNAGGEFEWPGMPANRIREAASRITREGFFLTSATLVLRAGGTVELTGEIPSSSGGLALQAQWEGVPVTELVDGRDGFILEGNCSGRASLRTTEAKSLEVEGSFLLRDGRLRNIPVLGTLARFTGLSRLDPLPVTELSGKFKRTSRGIEISELVMESQGLLRVEGALHFDNDGNLGGTITAGLTPSTLQWIPGSQERVFLQSRNGYLWTDVAVGGTIQNPTEDLSARLLRAMGEDVLSDGTGVLEAVRDAASGTPAEKVIDDAVDTTIQGVRGILNLLGPANKQ